MSIEQIGVGDVEILLDGKKYVLRPTIDAVLTICRLSGSLSEAAQKVAKLDVDTIVTVIQLGLGTHTARRLQNLPEIIWRAGLTDKGDGQLTVKVLDYLNILMNGGRPREEGTDNDNNLPQKTA